MARRILWLVAGVSAVIVTVLNFVVGGDVWSLGLLGFGLVGTLVAWKVPAHVTGPLMIGLSGASALTGSEALREALPSTEWLGPAMPLLMGLFVLTFPNGRVRARWRPIVFLAAGVTVVGIVVLAMTGDEGPYAVVPLMAFALATVVDLVVRYRAAKGEQKAQMRLVVFATVLVPAFLVLPGVIPGLAGMPDETYSLFVVAGFTLIPLAVGAAIVRYRLYDIDRIISRALTYAIVVALLAGAYAAMVWITTSILPAQGSLAVAASTLAVATAFNPLRKRVRVAVDRHFNRSSYQAQFVAEEFASKLNGSLTVDELMHEWLHTVDQTLQPQTSGIWINSELSATSRGN
jgi:hypothetical protein